MSTVGHIDFDRTVHNVACLLVISSFSYVLSTEIIGIAHVVVTAVLKLQSELQWVPRLMNSDAANMTMSVVVGRSERSKHGMFTR